MSDVFVLNHIWLQKVSYIAYVLSLFKEKKAKQADDQKRYIAKRCREDYRKSLRKLKTESQIIGVFMTGMQRAMDGSMKPIPGSKYSRWSLDNLSNILFPIETDFTCPPTDAAADSLNAVTLRTCYVISFRGAPHGRAPRPASQDDAMRWYKEVEEPRGAGVDAKTKRQADYFYGRSVYGSASLLVDTVIFPIAMTLSVSVCVCIVCSFMIIGHILAKIQNI